MSGLPAKPSRATATSAETGYTASDIEVRYLLEGGVDVGVQAPDPVSALVDLAGQVHDPALVGEGELGVEPVQLVLVDLVHVPQHVRQHRLRAVVAVRHRHHFHAQVDRRVAVRDRLRLDTLRRIDEDRCRQDLVEGVELKWSFQELGLTPGAPVSVNNPYQLPRS